MSVVVSALDGASVVSTFSSDFLFYFILWSF